MGLKAEGCERLLQTEVLIPPRVELDERVRVVGCLNGWNY